MSAEPAFTRSWQVGAFTATLSVPRPKPGEAQCACVEWSPHEPSYLSGPDLALYRFHRGQAIAELAAELGINVAVLDL